MNMDKFATLASRSAIWGAHRIYDYSKSQIQRLQAIHRMHRCEAYCLYSKIIQSSKLRANDSIRICLPWNLTRNI